MEFFSLFALGMCCSVVLGETVSLDVDNQLELPMCLRIEHTDDESRVQSGELRLLRCCEALWELNTKYRPGSKAVLARD